MGHSFAGMQCCVLSQSATSFDSQTVHGEGPEASSLPACKGMHRCTTSTPCVMKCSYSADAMSSAAPFCRQYAKHKAASSANHNT